jgi:hypothetical protein
MGWYRTTSAFVDKFDANTTDTRGQFYKDGQTKEIKGNLQMDMLFRKCRCEWYKVQIKQEISQMLIFYFRLADAYLMYAECA